MTAIGSGWHQLEGRDGGLHGEEALEQAPN